ncbi:transposase [Streptomyces sp. NPDC006314]|uniref:transposase n=1 Tax=Streptomyces sp. NPDC006314 TaxID=3154475 RepID=UPI0033BD3AAD
MTGASPFDRRKTGSKHHLICDGKATPLHVITTAAHVDDITRTPDLVDGIRPSPDDPAGPGGGRSASWANRRTT